MAVVNTTPDSFSDGGDCLAKDTAVAHGLHLLSSGADILDIGGESTRPGAATVSSTEEIRRVVPVISAIKAQAPQAIISVDTTKASVAAAALQAGAEIVNDISGLTFDTEMPKLVASEGCGVIIMHIRGTPANMQSNTKYQDLASEVETFLLQRVEALLSRGVSPEAIAVDPGIGFGKSVDGNLALIRNARRFGAGRFPVLIGPSRKSFIGALTGVREPKARLHGTCGAVLAAVRGGANIVRVHDVAPIKEALEVYQAVFPNGDNST